MKIDIVLIQVKQGVNMVNCHMSEMETDEVCECVRVAIQYRSSHKCTYDTLCHVGRSHAKTY